MKITLYLVIVLSVIAGIIGCSLFEGPESQGNLAIVIQFPEENSSDYISDFESFRAITSNGQDSVYAIITQYSSIVWQGELAESGDYFTSEISLDKGNDYEVTIEYYVDTYLAFTGTETGIHIKAGETTTVVIDLIPTISIFPSGLDAAPTSSSEIELNWTDNSVNEDGFKILRSGSVSGSFIQIADVSVDCTYYLDSGLTDNTEYFYRIFAYNITGNSGYSNTDSATTFQTAPDAPTDLQAIAISSSQIDLTWTDNSNNEDGFKIERKLGVSGTFSEVTDVGVDSTGYQDTGLNESTEYYYRICAYNNGGNSDYSNVANDTTYSSTDPILSFNPDTLDFDSTKTELTFEIWNSGGAVLNYVLSEDCFWITNIGVFLNGTSTGEHDSLTVDINRSGLTAGTYSDSIYITSNGGDAVINVEMVVSENLIIVEATLHLAVESMSFANFNCSIAQINSPNWIENTATWNNTHVVYETLTQADLYIDHLGTYEINCIDMIQNWLDGDPNYGLIIFAPGYQSDNSASISSKDNSYPSNRPYIIVKYSDSSEYTLDANADTYLNEDQPGSNFGNEEVLKVGSADAVSGLEVISLIKFNLSGMP